MTRATLSRLRAGLTATLAVAAWLLIGTGCASPSPSRLHAPPQGQSRLQHPMHENYVHMADNTLLEDMSMSSVHFVPHQAELNALGVRRLMRLASILGVYGGTIRYDGDGPDRQLRQDRTDEIEAFLAASGLEPGLFAVEQGLAGGEGMAASEAVEIRRATRGPNMGADSGGGSSEGAGSGLGALTGGS